MRARAYSGSCSQVILVYIHSAKSDSLASRLLCVM